MIYENIWNTKKKKKDKANILVTPEMNMHCMEGHYLSRS